MKKGRLDKFYPSFTGEERFRLHLEALYRGDEAEVKRLLESCPRKTYVMNEVDFAGRWEAAKEIVETLCLALAQLLVRLGTIESFREALSNLSKLRQRGGYRVPRRPPGRRHSCLGGSRQDGRPAGVESTQRRRRRGRRPCDGPGNAKHA